MSILVDNDTRLVVQGITGKFGSFHAKQMLAYGTKVVAGVTPGAAARSSSRCPCSTRCTTR
jgi:succinyl-CoA synthetase alpha subunit